MKCILNYRLSRWNLSAFYKLNQRFLFNFIIQSYIDHRKEVLLSGYEYRTIYFSYILQIMFLIVPLTSKTWVHCFWFEKKCTFLVCPAGAHPNRWKSWIRLAVGGYSRSQQREQAEVYAHQRIASDDDVITDLWPNELLELIIRRENLNKAYRPV